MATTPEQRKKFKERAKRLLHWSEEMFRYLPTIASLAAALLVIATFNPELIPTNWLTKLLITILLLIIPGSFWCGYSELYSTIHYSTEALLEIAEEIDTKGDSAKRLREDLGEDSPARMAHQ